MRSCVCVAWARAPSSDDLPASGMPNSTMRSAVESASTFGRAVVKGTADGIRQSYQVRRIPYSEGADGSPRSSLSQDICPQIQEREHYVVVGLAIRLGPPNNAFLNT